MRRPTSIILFLLVVCGVTILVGTLVDQRRRNACVHLEDDYLNQIDGLRQATEAQANISRITKPSAEMEKIIYRRSDAAADTMAVIGNRCGTRDAETARRKGNALLR
jgi:hypothetical protein